MLFDLPSFEVSRPHPSGCVVYVFIPTLLARLSLTPTPMPIPTPEFPPTSPAYGRVGRRFGRRLIRTGASQVAEDGYLHWSTTTPRPRIQALASPIFMTGIFSGP